MTDIIHNEPISTYHGRDSKTLGSTRISHFREHGPVWWDLNYNQRCLPRTETSDAMRQGSLLDCMLTEAATFESLYIAKPRNMSFATKEGKAWRDAQPDGIEIVPSEWIEIGTDCCKAVGEHKTASEMLGDPRTGRQVTLRHLLPNGLTLQSRPDFLLLNEDKTGWYIDLKKTDDLDAFGRKAIDYGYHRQLALCQWLAARAGYRIDAYLLAVEWQRGSRARLFKMPERCLEIGWQEVKETVDEIADRFKDQDWSDDHDGEVDELEIPGWMLARMDA